MKELLLLSLARLMAATHLNQVRFLNEGGQPIVAKRRRGYSPVVIFFGNWVSRMRRVPVIVMQNKAWHDWERRVNPAVNGFEAACDARGWLRVPLGEGRSLQEYLASSEYGLEQKLAALRVAARALRQLHETRLPGSGEWLSHGDATVRNVAYDAGRQRARWFDFDLRHDLRTEAALRHADDLRALIFSSLPWVEPTTIEQYAGAMLAGYGNGPALVRLRELVNAPLLDYGLYHLAQTLACAERRCACRAALLRGLDRMETSKRNCGTCMIMERP